MHTWFHIQLDQKIMRGLYFVPIQCNVNSVAVDSKTHSAGEAPQFSIVEQLKSSWWRAPERTRVFVGVPNFFFVLRVGARAAAAAATDAARRPTTNLGRRTD